MGDQNTVPRRINNVEGAAGQFIVNSGPGVVERFGDLHDNLATRGKLFFIPTLGVNGVTGWTKVENAVTVNNEDERYLTLTVPDQLAAADGRAYLPTWGLIPNAGVSGRIRWAQELFWQFIIERRVAEATSPPLCYVQLKQGSLAGGLVAQGIGIRIGDDGANPHSADRKLYGESYGSGGSDEVVDLGTTLAHATEYTIGIHHKPGNWVMWYVNGALAGTQSDTDHVPIGFAGATTFYVVSADKAGTDPDAVTYFRVGKFLVWQGY